MMTHRHTLSGPGGVNSNPNLATLALPTHILHYQTQHMFPNIFLLLALLFLTPKVFFNTNQNYPTFSIQQPTPTPMDVFKQTCQPQDNPLSIPMSLMHHHYSQDTMQSSVHFSYLRHMDQLKEKQEKFYAARHQRIQQQKGKLSTCSELPKCCERYTFLCENSVFMVPFTVVGFVLYFVFYSL